MYQNKKTQRLFMLLSIIFAVLLWNGGFTSSLFAQDTLKSHKLTFQKKDKKMKVVRSEDKTKTQVTAKRGEKIIWEATDSDLYFQFMDEDLFGTYFLTIKAGETKELVIGKKAKKGVNHYAVFSLKEKEFAEGDSPPAIIVE